MGAPSSRRQFIGVPVLASVVMTSWDFAQDPVWSTLLHAWRWKNGGAWFGVPLTNHCGWLLTTLLIYQLFAVYLHRAASAELATLYSEWQGPVVLYALCALGNILQLLKPQALKSIADPAGIYWRTSSILWASALVSFVVMGAFVLLAWTQSRNPKLPRNQRLNNSRSRFVCARLTGISVCFLSFIRNW